MHGVQIAANSKSQHQPARLTVLVVEDEVVVRMVVSDGLRDAGFEVLEAADADEALILIASALPIDLVMTDVRLGGSMDGLRLAGLVRRRRPDAKIVVVSGDLAVAPSPALADAFFSKPFELAAVARRLLGLLSPPNS